MTIWLVVERLGRTTPASKCIGPHKATERSKKNLGLGLSSLRGMAACTLEVFKRSGPRCLGCSMEHVFADVYLAEDTLL